MPAGEQVDVSADKLTREHSRWSGESTECAGFVLATVAGIRAFQGLHRLHGYRCPLIFFALIFVNYAYSVSSLYLSIATLQPLASP
jgi:hypothetical protein